MLLALLAWSAAGSPGAVQAPDGKPYSFVLFLADDLGAGELGCYGGREHRTPNLDRLAAEGMRFETAWATPFCSPTRVALMTGQYGFRTGWFSQANFPYAPQAGSPAFSVGARFTLADLLQPLAYATALTGKWQLGGRPPELIHDAGFDEYRIWAELDSLPAGVEHTGLFENKERTETARYWYPSLVENGRYLPTTPEVFGPDEIQEFALDFLRCRRDYPFLLYYSSILPHGPYLVTPDPERAGQRRPRGLSSYIEYLDHLTGELVAEIDRLGLMERTVIFWLGDNGTLGRGKGQLREEGVRVPLIVRCPGTIPAGVVSRALTDVTDILPTLAELAGAPLPEGLVLDGTSLVPVLRGERERHREWIFSYLKDGRMVRDERWLLELPGGGEPERLFDCGESRDPAGYREVTGSEDPEARAARARFARLLERLPGPEGFPGLIPERSGAEK
jgi:arylsulfatase A-like enzyme